MYVKEGNVIDYFMKVRLMRQDPVLLRNEKGQFTQNSILIRYLSQVLCECNPLKLRDALYCQKMKNNGWRRQSRKYS